MEGSCWTPEEGNGSKIHTGLKLGKWDWKGHSRYGLQRAGDWGGRRKGNHLNLKDFTKIPLEQ